jgi:hypothetical protein
MNLKQQYEAARKEMEADILSGEAMLKLREAVDKFVSKTGECPKEIRFKFSLVEYTDGSCRSAPGGIYFHIESRVSN